MVNNVEVDEIYEFSHFYCSPIRIDTWYVLSYVDNTCTLSSNMKCICTSFSEPLCFCFMFSM